MYLLRDFKMKPIIMDSRLLSHTFYENMKINDFIKLFDLDLFILRA